MTPEERCEAIKEMLEPCGWSVRWNSTDSQREPGFAISARPEGNRPAGVSIRASSQDSLEVAVARMENALAMFVGLSSHVYFVEPHREMGKL